MPTLRFSARAIDNAAGTATQCAVLPLFTGNRLGAKAQQLDEATGGSIRAALRLGDFSGKPGQRLQLPGAGKVQRLLLIGCGERKAIDRTVLRGFIEQTQAGLKATTATDATLYLDELQLSAEDTRWGLDYLARFLTTAAYRYTRTVSKPPDASTLARITVGTGAIPARAASEALRVGSITGIAINEARNLANLPGNICTPAHLATQARKLARRHPDLAVTVLEERAMRTLGMGALLSVSAGSRQPAKLIVLRYRGADAQQPPQVLVGKGITFDTGGISLKPGAKMDEMKFDMGGAASVLGVLQAVAELKLPINVVGIVAAAENMPGGNATKPGDVVTSMSGKTIEILNTDAEGRLVLCDALTYARRFKPAAIIDIATLTGACVVALGSPASGLFSNNDQLADALLSAGTESHDRAWRLPLWDDYQKQLKSNFADLPNIGGPNAGAVVAACFLSRFTEGLTWAHLDIAGSAWDSAPKAATGRPVALLVRYLLDCAGKKR